VAILVTMRVYSGRANPSWYLTEANARELFDKLDPYLRGSSVARSDKQKVMAESFRLGGLGYRGFFLKSIDDALKIPSRFAVYGGIVDFYDQDPAIDDESRDLERWLLSVYPPELDPQALRIAERERETIYRNPQCSHIHGPEERRLEGRPRYAPQIWNQSDTIGLNNCYAYANNRLFENREGADPGAGGGAPVIFGDCDDFHDALIADGLTRLQQQQLEQPLGGGWPMALFVLPPDFSDFHVYRQDSTGRWSHKPGGYPVRDCDEDGHVIINPRQANTLHYRLCGYYRSHSGAQIGSIRDMVRAAGLHP